MKIVKSLSLCLLIFAITLSFFTEEVEARRKILRGRKTLTRTYLRPMAIPAYAVVILVGVGQLLIGGIMYLIMRKVIIDQPLAGGYSLAQTAEA